MKNLSLNNLENAREQLNAHPSIRHIELMVPDINGVFRGKWLPLSALDTAYHEGIRLAGSLFALDMWGNEVHDTGMISENGDPDALCFPSVAGFQICQLNATPRAELLASMFSVERQPFFADPSHVLSGLLERLADLGYTAVVAVEMEFHLLLNSSGTPDLPSSQHATEVYKLAELHNHRQVFEDIAISCEQRGIPADTIIKEAGRQQFEVNLKHVADARLACEHSVLLKHIIKLAAQKHGYSASFMAKPMADDAGNGMHINISLQDEHGNNCFVSEKNSVNNIMQYAIAGLLALMRDSTLLFAPHANSYRRYQANAHAPTAVCWGVDNRNLAIRVPKNAKQAMRIEHRVAGADANPFLVVAGMIAGVLYGIDNKLSLANEVKGIPDVDELETLPHHWDHALQLFAQSAVLKHYLGEEFCEVYAKVKRQELDTIASYISDIEYQHYLLQS